ncbi:TAXI family TRAP transporter solute-binding subunit [Halomonas sp. MCCC 1A17488]|uniref:TAXI family TRAP transporter solute-binding subunit n=1 Tax=unclassified Halomonas TaxID=2609666 RepID=UPI0018D2637D|nr:MULTISPECIES: TAXI family TRAP transporter solute-binding subunit [unclassified Halomonas]MCE8018134.1 TAXI family TRAP transporter solute-binding subunit [Halomonas sp. MCCC 1A17488]MCG3241467.1 TAXI family TRAP transporter solute-binding subunit [Halomonas sp. MCCC 1A17488]QPP48574.1 TAXI family TRAP transporter solute-binding subunit [Halomonas sp. SS10-MC5]
MPHPKHAFTRTLLASATAVLVGATALSAQAETRVTYKSASAGTAYYQMGVELSEAIRQGTDGEVVLTLEESQGSVQNVMEVMARQGNYVFTTPPGLVEQAMAGEGPFAERQSPRFEEIRGLFPIPSITMHFVVAGDAGVIALEDLEGKEILIGRGTFGAREAERYLELFDLQDKVEVADAEIGSGPDALKNGQIDAFVTASSFPTPNVIETAASMPVSLVSLTDEQIEQTGAARQTIPAGTYNGIDEAVETTSLPVIAYTTTNMDEETAYTLTKTFWERRDAMAEESPWWGGITPDMIGNIAGTLHPGAVRYYDEADIEIPDDLR